MKIGLIDVDGHNYPNLPLMKLSAWHKQHGDDVGWYSAWSGLQQEYDKVYMSKVFSFSPDYDLPIYAKEVEKGGTGYCIELVDGKEVFHKERNKNLPDEIEHIYPDYSIYAKYTQDTAYGFLTRGCPRGCEFCHVAPKEGRCSVKVADLSEFWRGQKKIVLNDPNILACREHLELLQQLVDSKARVEFNQGLDIRLVTEKNIALLKQIKIDTIHFAFDRFQDKDIIEPRLRQFAELWGGNKCRQQVQVYILTNFDTTLEQDMYRIQLCRELNMNPYMCIYDKEHSSPIYNKIQRWVNRRWVFWSCPTFEEYNNQTEENENQTKLF